MNLLFWLAVAFMVIGPIALFIIKMKMKTPSVRALLWLIGGTTVWGVVSIMLVPWVVGRLVS